jgi:hypothetical protein
VVNDGLERVALDCRLRCAISAGVERVGVEAWGGEEGSVCSEGMASEVGTDTSID